MPGRSSLEIWTTPWGFLKGAAANNATVKAQSVGGQRYQVVSWMTTAEVAWRSGVSRGGLHQPAQVSWTASKPWLGDPVLGDMLVEADLYGIPRRQRRHVSRRRVQKRAGQPTFDLQTLGIRANPGQHPARW